MIIISVCDENGNKNALFVYGFCHRENKHTTNNNNIGQKAPVRLSIGQLDQNLKRKSGRIRSA